MTTALLFPGQGSQKVGMGKSLADSFRIARDTFQEADDALGFSLSTLCFEGPAEELTLTKFTQPAIVTTSIAAWRVAQAELGLEFEVAAGHSLGEFSALVAASALGFADAVRLVHLRGQAMQRAVPSGAGAMAAVLGLTTEAAGALCEAAAQGQVCEPANLNGGGQVVISGHVEAIDRAVAAAKGHGAKRAVKLNVSAPFHCSLMEPAAQELAAALREVEVAQPRVPVVANVTAEPNQDAGRVKSLLVEQVTHPVRWESSVLKLVDMGVTHGYELGAGAVLRGLVRRIAKDLSVASVGESSDLDKQKA